MALSVVEPEEMSEIAKELLAEARVIAESGRVEGYAIIAFNKDFENYVMYNTGGVIPSSVLPAYVQGILTERVITRNMQKNGYLEDE